MTQDGRNAGYGQGGQPTHIGPYEVLGKLGQGAMAVVWRAWDPNLEREVAIKVPQFSPSLSPEARDEMGRRFVREARTAGRLNHPNIVTIYAADVYGETPAIVMELVHGTTLGTLLASGPLGLDAATDALTQLCDAVGYAHAQNIVHRDIKPENIFVSEDGLIKLADFGIAHMDGLAQTHATIVGTVLGSPGYMSPEQAKGEPVDARSDLFSVGVVAYEMLCGCSPFGIAADGSVIADATTVLYRTVYEDVVDPKKLVGAALPDSLRTAILAALSKDPADRPQTAEEFVALVRGETGHGRRRGLQTTALSGTAARSGRPWLPYALVGGLGLVVVVALLLFSGAGSGGGGAVRPAVGSTAAADAAAVEEDNGSAVAKEVAKETEAAQRVANEAEAAAEAQALAETQVQDPVFTGAEASSVLAPGIAGADYEPYSATDGAPNTAWVEGVEGNGEGSWLALTADGPQWVHGIHILNGFCKTEELYYKNNRCHDITIGLSDGTSLDVTLDDVYGEYQTIDFDDYYQTTYIRVTINSVYVGTRYEDTCISEMLAY